MTDTCTESTSNDSVQETNTKWIGSELTIARKDILAKIASGPEDDREREFQTHNFKFFDEDWENSKNDLLEDSLFKRNIYGFFLVIFKELPDRKRSRGKIYKDWYFDNFISWLENTGEEENIRNTFLTDEITEKATRLAVKDSQVASKVQRIFKVSDDEVISKALEMINENLENGNLKEAADFAIRHGLVDNYSFEELVLPIIALDKVQPLMELLKVSKKFQKGYISFLDNFISRNEEYITKFFEKFKERGMLKVGLDRYVGKSLTHLIQKFFNGPVKEFGFDLEERRDAPCYSNFIKGKALKFFTSNRFIKNDMSDSTYFEHVSSTLPQCDEDTVFYFFSLLCDGQFPFDKPEVQSILLLEAVFWTIHLNIPRTSTVLPFRLRKLFQNPNSRLIEEAHQLITTRTGRLLPDDEVKPNSVLSVEMKDKAFPIEIVTSEEQVEQLCSKLEAVEEGSYIGYDSEFRPNHLVEQSSRLSIIQLFLKDIVYILDVISLENRKIGDEKWKLFFQCLFQSDKFKVVAFDARNDMLAIFSISAIKSSFTFEDVNNVVCLSKLTAELNNVDPTILKLPLKSCTLKLLTQEMLGLELNKDERLGNWQMRPMKKSQVIYAALDAVATLESFEKVLDLAGKMLSSEQIENLINMSDSLPPKKAKKEVKVIDKIPWNELYELLHTHRNPNMPLQKPSQLKVIVDMMLLGLAKNLKFLGVDVFATRCHEEFLAHIKLMKSLGPEEQRYVITIPSKSFESLKIENPEANFVLLENSNQKHALDLLIAFFDSFNLDIPVENGCTVSQ